MTDDKTLSEILFERFLSSHGLTVGRVPVADTPRPDYLVEFGTLSLLFEVKELTEDDDFSQGSGELSTRTVGAHIRSKTTAARKQIQFGAKQGIPSVLLIYNALDPWHMFGTEPHDFRAAMHGDWTLQISKATGQVMDSGYGKNRFFRADHNTSFSALGHLAPQQGQMTVKLFPNEHAKVQLPPNLPPCFELA